VSISLGSFQNSVESGRSQFWNFRICQRSSGCRANTPWVACGVDFEIFEFDRGVADAGQILHEVHAESQNRDFVHVCCRTVWIQWIVSVAAARLLIASRGGASPQKFEKRALTIFRLEPKPYKSAHQLNCSLLFPTAMVNGIERYNNFLLSDPTNNKHQRRLIVSTFSETQQKQTKSILPAQLTEQENFTPIAERATDS